MSNVINLTNCQRVCLQFTGTSTITPYSWSPSNNNVTVTTGGTNTTAIVTGVSGGGCNVSVKDANGSILATFIISITDIASYTPPSTSNTVYLGSKSFTQASTAPPLQFTGTFSSLSSGFGPNNYIWFAFNNTQPGTCSSSGSIPYTSWDRSSNTMVFNASTCLGGNSQTYFVAGVAITSTTPADPNFDYQVPIVAWTGAQTQSSKFSATLTLPFQLPCSDTSKYLVFGQAGTNSSNAAIAVSSVQSSNVVKLGFSGAVTSYIASYMIVAKGIRKGTGTGILYSDLLTARTFTTGNTPITTSLQTTVTNGLWFAQPQNNNINDATATTQVTIVSASVSGSTLTITYTNASGSNITADLAIFAINNLNTAAITSASF